MGAGGHTPVVPGGVVCDEANVAALFELVDGVTTTRGVVEPHHDGKCQEPNHRAADVKGLKTCIRHKSSDCRHQSVSDAHGRYVEHVIRCVWRGMVSQNTRKLSK